MMENTESIVYNGIEMEVTGEYLEYVPATMYRRNGDPGNPAEGGYIDGASISIGGVDVTDILDDACIEAIESMAWNQWQGVEV